MPANLASHEDVRWLLNHDRTLALLRKETAALLIPFLYATFHGAHQTTYLSNDLHARLTDWLFDLNDAAPDPDEANADDRRRYPSRLAKPNRLPICWATATAASRRATKTRRFLVFEVSLNCIGVYSQKFPARI